MASPSHHSKQWGKVVSAQSVLCRHSHEEHGFKVGGPMTVTDVSEQVPDGELLNHDALVARCMGNHALVQRLLARYADTGHEDCEAMDAALRARDITALAAVAHRLKGSSGIIGADRISQLSSTIEKQSGSADWETLGSMVAALSQLQGEASQRCQEKLKGYHVLEINGGGE